MLSGITPHFILVLKITYPTNFIEGAETNVSIENGICCCKSWGRPLTRSATQVRLGSITKLKMIKYLLHKVKLSNIFFVRFKLMFLLIF